MGRLRFRAREKILRYTRGRFLQATRDEVIHYGAWHDLAILRMDQPAFGEDLNTYEWKARRIVGLVRWWANRHCASKRGRRSKRRKPTAWEPARTRPAIRRIPE
ncbi:MAG: hypothetical protein R2818_06930 [Flavobacteriales bacterium]